MCSSLGAVADSGNLDMYLGRELYGRIRCIYLGQLVDVFLRETSYRPIHDFSCHFCLCLCGYLGSTLIKIFKLVVFCHGLRQLIDILVRVYLCG